MQNKRKVLFIFIIFILSIFVKELNASTLFDFNNIIKKEELTSDSAGVVDDNLKRALNKELNENYSYTRPLDQDLTISDMRIFTGELDLMDKKIENISGLEYAINVEDINLNLNNITDISPVKGMVNLKKLHLLNNNIEDISPVKDLKDLTELILSSNNIKDITVLENLDKLTNLSLQNNKISNIEPLRNLQSLFSLDISSNQISDLSPIKENNIIVLKANEQKIVKDYENSLHGKLLPFKVYDQYGNLHEVDLGTPKEGVNDYKGKWNYGVFSGNIDYLNYGYNPNYDDGPSFNIDDNKSIKLHEIQSDQDLKNLFNVRDIKDDVDSLTIDDIKVDQSNIDYNKGGIYKVLFSLIDSDLNEITKEVNLEVVDPFINIPDNNLKKSINEGYLFQDADADITQGQIEGLNKDLNLSDKGIENIIGLEYAINIKSLDLSKNKISDFRPIQNLSSILINYGGQKIEFLDPVSRVNKDTPKYIVYDIDGTELYVTNFYEYKNEDEKVTYKGTWDNRNSFNGVVEYTYTYEPLLNSNEKPEITIGKEVEIEIGIGQDKKNEELIDLFNVSAFDYEDRDITNKIIVDQSNVKYDKVGTYDVKFNISDTFGNKAEEKISKLTIIDDIKPKLTSDDTNFVNLHELKTDEELITLFNVNSIDNVDGDITDKVIVDQTDVDYDNPGVYKVLFSVVDDQNNKASKEVSLEIKDPIIIIPDDKLKRFLNEDYFFQNTYADITQSQMESLINLDLNDKKIKNITGLEYAKNIENLELNNNQINDITSLSGLINLNNLGLNDNQISDISPLSGLINLNNLDLNDNQISDISPLSGLINLNNLGLNDNQISDISPLSGLINLNNLGLNDNQISGISYLSKLINLTELNLSQNQVTDISSLSGLVNLTDLNLSQNQVIDISSLSGLTNLTDLNLSQNQVIDISSLSGLKNLETLFLTYNQISDISPLKNLPLKRFNIEGQKIKKEFNGVGHKTKFTVVVIDVDGTKYEVDMGEIKQGNNDYTGNWDNGKNFSGTVNYNNYKYDTVAPDLKFDDNMSTPVQKSLSDDELKSLFNVSAIDFVEGDLTSDVVVDQSAVNYEVPGNYKVTFSVTDPTGNSISKDANLEVKMVYPTISADDIYTNVDSISSVDIDEFLLNNANISVGETTKKLNDVVVKSTNLTNDSKVGIYEAKFEVSNDLLESASTNIKVYVANGSDIIDDTNPYIFANDISVDAGSKIDNSLYGAVAFDKEDGDLSSAINYPTVDTSTAGKKATKLSVSDKSSNNSEVSVNVDVIDNIKPVIVASDSRDIEVNSTLSSDEAKKLFNVSVSDNVDSLTIDDVSVDMSSVDLNTVGTYDVIFSVSDKSSNSTTKTSKLNVIDNDVPVINSLSRLDIKAKKPLSDEELKSLFKVSAIDNYDGDITSDVVVNQRRVNYDVPGVYDVVFSVVDNAGNRADKKVFLKILSNEAPVLKGVEDIEIIVGNDFDPIDGVSANDYEDGDISNNIKVYSKDLKDGLTQVYNYSITDSDGNVVEVNRTVKYVNAPTNNKPIIDGVDNKDIFVGEDFDPMEGVSAKDYEDGNLTSSISVSGSVNNNVSGDYTLTYSVVDSDNNTVSVDRIINVKDITIVTNNKPVISGGDDVKVKLGSDFDVMAGITANDVEDGDLSSNIIVVRNELDTSIVGDYNIVYSVSDSDSNISNVSRTISVYDDENKVINNVDSKDNNSIDDKGSNSIDDKDSNSIDNINVNKNLISTGKSSIYLLFVSFLSFLAYFINIKKVNIKK